MSSPEAPSTDGAPASAPERSPDDAGPGLRRLGKLALFSAVFVATLWGMKQAGFLPEPRRSWMGKSASPLRPGTSIGEGGEEVVTLVPRYGQIMDFQLVEASGEVFSREDLEGKVWVASFLFTNCAATCPAMANRNRILQGSLPEGVQLVSISVDPMRDTPEVLREWGRFHQRDPDRWKLLTGEWEAISELATKGFYLGGDEPMLHSTRFALVDPHGALRGYYDSRDEEEMSKLVRDVSLVLSEAPPRS